MENLACIIGGIFVAILIFAASFCLFALVEYGVYWAFSWTFSLKFAFGHWLIWTMISFLFASYRKAE